MLVACAVASDTERSPKRIVNDDELSEHDKRVSKLLDNVDLCEMLIRRLEDGGHVAAKKDKTAKDNNATPQSFLWPPNPGQLSVSASYHALLGADDVQSQSRIAVPKWFLK